MSAIIFHQMNREEVLISLKTSHEGLSENEVNRRQQLYPNKLPGGNAISPVSMLLNQFTDTMVLVLLGAAVISGAIGAMVDTLTILAIIVLNAVLGFIQEYRAERSLEEIKQLTSPAAIVIRGNKRYKVEASSLVPGDIVILETGDKIPADARLLTAYSMGVDESALTGESIAVEKDADNILAEETSLAERINMVFMGTSIVRGRGTAVVVATGIDTIVGEIAQMIQQTVKNMTPLQRKLDQLGKNLIAVCIVVCASVAMLGIYRGEPVMAMLLTGISLAVAAIPEGLPAIVTIVLAVGVQRMAKQNAVIRKLPAVETLGCTTVICSDKTGTLTQNRMTVTRVSTFDDIYEIRMDNNIPEFINLSNTALNIKDPVMDRLLKVAYHCNNAVSEFKQNGNFSGDPTEIALKKLADKEGVNKSVKRLLEIPFDSDRKRMSVIVEDNDQVLLYCKGALDSLIPLCSSIYKQGKIQKLSRHDLQQFIELQSKWAAEALRVLGFAYRELKNTEAGNCTEEELENNLVLLGIVGMIDPPRPGVADSVAVCQQAGIIPIMITGDHPDTALAIGRMTGITNQNEVINGIQIDKMSDRELYDRALKSRVFARVTPQHKFRIVTVMQKRRQVVAMTGDGVNDAPAVKAADIGVAMGKTGTEVTREASCMVLTDDNFSTIVAAVYEGRAIYDNIRKFLRYLLGCNIGEILVMFLASLLCMPLPLLPIQILWVNLITDGLPAMALGMEPPEKGIMERPPRPVNESIFARGLGWKVFNRGIFIAVITLTSFITGMLYCKMNAINDLSLPQTMALTTLVLSQLCYVFECRSETRSPFELGIGGNRFLLAAVFCSLIMQLIVLYTPFAQKIFHTVALNSWQWAVIISLSSSRLLFAYIRYLSRRIFVSGSNYVKINAR
ncbi:MAG: cation-translocating P-type ATPase [Syntrophomonadaceae bacterium]|nr:cation-translocating P-type ATPase [Syntrophomonadaceae bacterium]